MSVMLYPCILCVAMLIGPFVLCVCELFGETIRNVFVWVWLFLFVFDCYGSVY